MNNTTIKTETLWNLRIKNTDKNLNVLNLSDEFISDKLKNVEIVITPYTKRTNIITYSDYNDQTQTKEIDMSDDLSSLDEKTKDYINKGDYLSIDEVLIAIISEYKYLEFEYKINLVLSIDLFYEDKIILDESFMEFILSKFKGSYEFELSSNTYVFWPEGSDISIDNLIYKNGYLFISKVNVIRTNSFSIQYCNINSLDKNNNGMDKILFITKDSSDLSYCTIYSPLHFETYCEIESKYKWLNSVFQINGLHFNFSSDSDRLKKFNSIIKISSYNNISIIGVSFEKALSKLIPIKIENSGDVSIIGYNNTERVSNKGLPEISFVNTGNISITDSTIISDEKNLKETAVFNFTDIDNFMNIRFDEINIINNDLFNISNCKIATISINKLNVVSKYNIFSVNKGTDGYIDEISIENSNLSTKSMDIENIDTINFYSSVLNIENDLILKSLNFLFINSEMISTNAEIYSSGQRIDEENIQGKIDLSESVLSISKNLKLYSERNNSKLSIETTKIESMEYLDERFTRSSLKNCQLISQKYNFNSIEYLLKDCIIDNKMIVSNSESVIFKGDVRGSLELYSNTGNSFFPVSFVKDTNDYSNRSSLNIIVSSSNLLKPRIDIKNYCLSILFKQKNSSSNAIFDIYCFDDSEENYFYTTGNYLFKEKGSSLNFNYKNFTVDKQNYLIENDGTKDINNEKLNLGIKP